MRNSVRRVSYSHFENSEFMTSFLEKRYRFGYDTGGERGSAKRTGFSYIFELNMANSLFVC